MMNLNQDQAFNSGENCPLCKGSGQIIERESVEGFPGKIEFSKPCPKCGGRKFSKSDTGVPPEFLNAYLPKFGFNSYSVNVTKIEKIAESFVDDFEKWQLQSKGIYLWSEIPGSGKTFLASCLANSVSVKYRVRTKFITVVDYLALVGEGYKKERGQPDESKIFRECDLLILDDVGTQKNGEWQQQEVFRLIDGRMINGKITLFTSNLPPEKLNLDERTKNRIIKSSIVLRMPEESIRGKLAEKQQQDFLEKILG